MSEVELKWFRTQLSAIQQENRHLVTLHSRMGTTSSPAAALPKSSSTSARDGGSSDDTSWELLDKNGSNGHLWSVAPQEWFAYDFFSEFHRQKIDWEVWGTSFINTSFEACGTYPPFLIVPASLVAEEEKNENQRRLNAQNHGGSLAGFLSAPSWAASVAERRTRQQHAVVESVLEAAFSPTDTSRNHTHSPLHDGVTVSTNTTTKIVGSGSTSAQPFPRTPLLADAFQCRSSQRLQVLTYYHAPTRAAILRSSQPMSLRCRTYYSSTHQTYWNELLKASPSGRVLVVDLRPFVNAAANMALGGGYEAPQYATASSASQRIKKVNGPMNEEEEQTTATGADLVDAGVAVSNNNATAKDNLDVEIHFANIANIHVVRAAYEAIPTAAEQLMTITTSTSPTANGHIDDSTTTTAETQDEHPVQTTASHESSKSSNGARGSYREYMQSWLKWKKDSSKNAEPSSASSDAPDETSSAGFDLRVAPPSVVPEALTAQYRLVLNALDVIVSNVSGTSCFSTGDDEKKTFTPRNVLLHCTDGWDRTSQLCALSQLLLDPYFRTPKGFCVLVEKDFVSFGHQFRLRGSSVGKNRKKSSPIFLQFMDVVYAILISNPHRFEFGPKFLMSVLALEAGCLCGMFAGNCIQEAVVTLQVHRQTLSLWECLCSMSPVWRQSALASGVGHPSTWKLPPLTGNEELAPWHAPSI